MKKRTYHGWIYKERESGFKAHFSVMYYVNDKSVNRAIGYGKAAEAVDVFEKELKLGPVRLESTPIGLRVFTEKEEQ